VESLLKERDVTLEWLTARVSASRAVTASDKAELQSDLSTDLTAMQELQQEVPSDATCAALVANAETMVYDYRVYLVMTPQADLVVVADTESAVASVGVRWEPGIQAAITYAANHGKDVAQAQQALDDLKTQLTDALAQLQGLSATVLAQTPAGSPGNHAVFVTARDKCQAAFANLQDARKDLATILSAL
jgi:precorrin-3B methylase